MNITIMVIDDFGADAVDIMLFIAKRNNDITLIEHKNPIEALTALETVSPDVIILDYRMPKMTGLEVLAALNEKGNKIPVIFYSADKPETIRDKALELGAKFFVQKNTNSFVPDMMNAIQKCTGVKLET